VICGWAGGYGVAVNVGIGVGMRVFVGRMVGTEDETGVSTEVLVGVVFSRILAGKQADISNNKKRVEKLFFIKCIYIVKCIPVIIRTGILVMFSSSIIHGVQDNKGVFLRK
jgi:hypothetical protein